MNLMISPLAPQPASATPHAGPALDIISCATGECELGRLLVARSLKGVCAILFGDNDDELGADLAARFSQAVPVANEAVVRDDLAKVVSFVEHPVEKLNLARSDGTAGDGEAIQRSHGRPGTAGHIFNRREYRGD